MLRNPQEKILERLEPAVRRYEDAIATQPANESGVILELGPALNINLITKPPKSTDILVVEL